jgi:hypothetical protein
VSQSVNYSNAGKVVTDSTEDIYQFSFYQVWGDNTFNYIKKDIPLVKRINVRPEWDDKDLLKILDVGADKRLPFYDNFQDDNGWVNIWGDYLIKDQSLTLKASDSTEGSMTFLDGSPQWENYSTKVDIDWKKGNSFSMLSRFVNSNNFISCNYKNNAIRIEKNINGKNVTISEIEKNFNFIGRSLKLEIRTNNKVECLVNDKIYAYANNVDSGLMNGGIGFKVWDSKLNNSEVIIKEVKVEEIK